jgi:molecular chaperone GrpE
MDFINKEVKKMARTIDEMIADRIKDEEQRTAGETPAAQPSQGEQPKPAEVKPDDAQLVKQYLDDKLRLLAEFDNYKKRTQKEREELRDSANAKLILELLKIVDEFELALPEIKEESTKKGIAMVYERLMKLLKEYGVNQIPATGKFNHELHEAVMQVSDSDKPDGEIFHEIRKGYFLHSKVIRLAVVSVSRKEEEAK